MLEKTAQPVSVAPQPSVFRPALVPSLEELLHSGVLFKPWPSQGGCVPANGLTSFAEWKRWVTPHLLASHLRTS